MPLLSLISCSTPFSRTKRWSLCTRLPGTIAAVVLFAVAAVHTNCIRRPLTIDVAANVKIVERTIRTDGETRSYYVYLPAVVNPDERLPVLLYLHGSGQDGDIWDIAGNLGAELRMNPGLFPCIIVFPRCPGFNYWIGPVSRYAVAAMLESAGEFHGDTSRLLVSGVSIGGYGSYICAIENPGTFAAVAPICGGAVPPVQLTLQQQRQLSPACRQVLDAQDPYAAMASLLGKTPVWLFHGSEDEMVPVSESRSMESALKTAGGNVRYTEFKDMGHDISRSVYGDRDFLAWLFSQRR